MPGCNGFKNPLLAHLESWSEKMVFEDFGLNSGIHLADIGPFFSIHEKSKYASNAIFQRGVIRDIIHHFTLMSSKLTL